MEKLLLPNLVQTAFIAIDLQHGTVGRELAPYGGAEVVRKSKRIADTLRAQGGLIVWVRADIAALLHLPSDAPMRAAGSPPPPASASELVPELAMQAGDVCITKRQWGAFYGTDLDQHLRRHGIKTIVMSGIATNFGVESTARGAFDRGYELVFAEDAMTSLDAAAHAFACTQVFPRMGRVRSTDEVVAAIAGGGSDD
jgi:nicotinamidase-related amidase